MASGNTRSGGVSFCGLLGIAFIVLKLCGVIGWGWLWVLAPFWMPLAIFVVVVVIAAIVLAAVGD